MKKQEFLDKLKRRLSILNDEEVEDILTEYEAHINEKMHAGKTEEEAIADFGDFNELVKEILGAYKIKDKADQSSRSTGEFEAWIHKAIDEITDFARPLIDRVSTLEGQQIGYFIAYLILTLIMVSLIGIPFWLIEKLGVALLSVIPLGVGAVFGAIFTVALKIGQLVVSILIIIYGIQRAIEAATLKKPVNFGVVVNVKDEKTEPKEKPEPKEQPKPKPDPQPDPKPDPRPQPEVKASSNPEPSPRVVINDRSETKQEGVILPAIGNFFVLLFKGFVFLCMIPGFMLALGLMVALGVLIALLFKGIIFVGLFLIIIGCLMAVTTILDMINKTVFRKGSAHAR